MSCKWCYLTFRSVPINTKTLYTFTLYNTNTDSRPDWLPNVQCVYGITAIVWATNIKILFLPSIILIQNLFIIIHYTTHKIGATKRVLKELTLMELLFALSSGPLNINAVDKENKILLWISFELDNINSLFDRSVKRPPNVYAKLQKHSV